MRLFLITLLILASITPGVISAYSVSPLLIDRETEGRDIIKQTITLSNPSNSPARIYASVHEVALDEGGTIKEFIPPSEVDNKTAITSWIEITRGRIVLEPGEVREIPVTIRMNPNAAPGQYHGLIGFGTGSNRTDAEARVLAGTAPATIVRLSLNEKRTEFLRLKNFIINRFVTDDTDGAISYEIENPGESPVTPTGEIIFYDNRGNEVGATAVNPEGVVVEAGKSAAFTSSVPDNQSLGRYKAFLSVEYGKKQLASVHDTAFFYMIPFKQLIMLFGLFLLLAVLLTWWLHRRMYRAHGIAHPDHEVVPMYIRSGSDAPKFDHDIDLKKKPEENN